MDEHRSFVYKSQMQNGLFITSVFFFLFFFFFFDIPRSFNFKIRVSNNESCILLPKGAKVHF